MGRRAGVYGRRYSGAAANWLVVAGMTTTAARYVGRMAQIYNKSDTMASIMQEAVDAYTRDTGTPPAIIAVNSGVALTEFHGIPVVQSRMIRPGHALAGMEIE